MQTVLVEKITNLINRALMLDEKNFKSLINLANKKIAFDIVGLNVKIILSITKEGLVRCKPDDELVDVTIKASVTTFLGIMLSRENSSAASAGAMEISGDVGLAQEFLSILKTLDIDWEELASQWIGDLPAHKLGNMFRTTRKFAKEIRQTIGLDISEYLRYEKEILPEQEEIDEYISAVDVIRNDSERLKQRIIRLQRKIIESV